MPIGAVIVVDPSGTQFSTGADGPTGRKQPELFNGCPIACLDILGSSILQRMTADWRQLGLGALVIVAERGLRQIVVNGKIREASVCPARCQSDLWPSAEQIIGEFAACGIDTALVARVGAYAEPDVSDLLRFHKESGSAMTRAHDETGALDLWVVNTDHPAFGLGIFSNARAASTSITYKVSGYINRLATAHDMRKLVKDSLLGRCALRPQGVEVRPGVWMGEGVSLHRSARIVGPAYLGHGTHVREGSLVTRFSSVERGCTVDCGTSVENASILPHTYLGAGLDVAHAVVCGDLYFSCKWDEAVQIADPRIIASHAPSRVAPTPPETAAGSRVGDLLRGLLRPESVNSIGLAAERNISAS